MKRFLKEWGFFLLFLTVFLLSRWFIWFPVTVEGHSMDPTLTDRERLIVIKTAHLDRFDVVVADETDNGVKKQVVKRIIGIPGDTITYDNDVLTINGEEIKEDYLTDYLERYQADKLQETYSYNPYFQNLAKNSKAFTHDATGNTQFTVTIPEGHYYLLGDDRLVSKDSRAVGTFATEQLVGEVKFRYWPFTEIGVLK